MVKSYSSGITGFSPLSARFPVNNTIEYYSQGRIQNTTVRGGSRTSEVSLMVKSYSSGITGFSPLSARFPVNNTIEYYSQGRIQNTTVRGGSRTSEVSLMVKSYSSGITGFSPLSARFPVNNTIEYYSQGRIQNTTVRGGSRILQSGADPDKVRGGSRTSEVSLMVKSYSSGITGFSPLSARFPGNNTIEYYSQGWIQNFRGQSDGEVILLYNTIEYYSQGRIQNLRGQSDGEVILLYNTIEYYSQGRIQIQSGADPEPQKSVWWWSHTPPVLQASVLSPLDFLEIIQ